GVVQIFTKRGQQGVPRVTFSTRLQTDAVRKTLDVNMATNDQGKFIGNDGEPLVNEDGSPGQRYDFQDFIFDRAYGTEQYLSVSGGASGTNYFVSGSHFVNEGVVKGNLFRRLNGRVRVGQTLSDWANVSVGTSFTRSKSDDVPNGGLTSNYGSLTGFIFGPNTYDPRPDEFGRYPNLGVLANPIEVIDQYDFTQETRRFIGDVQLEMTPLEGFGLDYTLGFDTYNQESIAFIPRGTSAPGLGTGQSRRATLGFLQLNNDLNLRYQADLSESIASTTLLGGTMQYEQVENFSGQSQNLTPIAEVVNSGTSSIVIGESRSERMIYGVFAQETIGLGERLFLTATGRFDASSVFGEDERWQFYPKASASYLISEESFWQNGSLGRYVPSIKLRGAIGTSGGLTAIGAFDRFTNYFPQSYGGNPGLQPSSILGATDIKPERQREIEVGADLGLLNNRLAIEFTYYNQRTTDLLLTRQVAPSSGFLTRLENTGVLENKGIELLVRAVPINQRAFRWSSSITYARNRNKVTGLVEEENPEGILILGGFGLVGAVEGQPLGVFYGSAYQRKNQDLDSPLLENGPVVDAEGNVLEDLEAGIPARSGRSKIIGDPNPDFTASWINEFTIGTNLSVRAQVDAVIGQDVFNFTRRLAALGAFGTLTDFERELEGDLPAGYNAATFSTFERWVEDGSFVKLRELSVAYTLYPQSATVRSVRLSLVGRNLFSIDDYSGYDPEVSVAGQRSNIRNFDFVEVPIPRTFSFGVTLGF
ncbi:MAG TPA: TonB-dependent receptor, partial [Rhodothermales bacterium]|nr:TonB-dependent receptor [Rhodothermales bacterium]